jgi:succinate dehydrogenase/fumarate reductase cytochrome b subunit
MHYANTSLIPLITQSAAESDKYLLLTRPYYQSFPLEALMIFAPILTHVITGVALRLYRRRISAIRHGAETFSQRKSIPWPKFSLTSALGYITYPLFVGHVLTMRIAPKNVEGSSAGVGLRYWAHGIAHNPWIGNIGYAVFMTVASFHVVTGAAKYLKVSREYITEGGQSGMNRRKWRGRIVNGVAALMAGVWIAGSLGVVSRSGMGQGWEAKNWDKIYSAVPLIGRMF